MSYTKVLGLDPGSKNMGWACVSGDSKKNKPPIEHGGGIFGVVRTRNKRGKNEPYQQYRLRVIEFWVKSTLHLLSSYEPDLVVSEIIPPVVGDAFKSNGVQSQLATTAITTVQAIAVHQGYELKQISAVTVKKKIGKTSKASKVAIRNGVYELIPSTKRFAEEWKVLHDGSDAYGVALTQLGYVNE